MLDFRKLFAREARADHEAQASSASESNYRPEGSHGDGLEVEYQHLIAAQFRRWGIKPAHVTIEVRCVGQASDGFDVLVGMVRLTRWDRISSLRVMLGLPLLENRVRKALGATWLADLSHFGGLWLRASEQVQSDAYGVEELRQVLMQLVPPSQTVAAREGRASGPRSSFSSTPDSQDTESPLGSAPARPARAAPSHPAHAKAARSSNVHAAEISTSAS